MTRTHMAVRRPCTRDRKDRVHSVSGCTDRRRFYCRSGKHWVCWCRGAADDMPETCDWCWYQKHKHDEYEVAP